MTTVLDGWSFQPTAKKNELHVGLGIPKPIAIEIHNWAEEQDWPEGIDLEPIEEYHITMLYAPEGHDEKDDLDLDHDSHAVSVKGITAFPSKEREGQDAIVLLIESETIRAHHDELADEAEDSGIDISPFSHDDFKPHITIAYGSLPKGLKPPTLTFETEVSEISPPRDKDESLTDLLRGSYAGYGCGQIWVNQKEHKVLINVGDGEGDVIDRIRELAQDEWPDYDVDIDAEVGFPGDGWKLDPLSAAKPTKQEDHKSSWRIARVRPPYEAELLKFADSWTPKDQWPNALRERNGEPVDADCTCKDGHKLDCPVHGMHPSLPTYDDTLDFPDPNNPAGYDYHADAPRTWMRAETKVSAEGNQLNWEPGRPGKGMLDPQGNVHTWTTDGQDGMPSYVQYAEKVFGLTHPKGIVDEVNYKGYEPHGGEWEGAPTNFWDTAFNISRAGRVKFYKPRPEQYGENDPHNYRRVVEEADPRFKDVGFQGKEQYWDFLDKTAAKRAKHKQLWVDDTRHPPDDSWDWARNVAEAIELTKGPPGEPKAGYEHMSLDHDLSIVRYEGKVVVNPDALDGGDFVLWLHEHGDKKHMPDSINIHSHNEHAVEIMVKALEPHTKVTIKRAPDELEESWARQFKVHEPSEIEKESVKLPEQHHHTSSHQLTWLPGSNLRGKGLVTPNGDVHTWPVDAEGMPHHAEYVDQRQPYQLHEGTAHFFQIRPRGGLDTKGYKIPPNIIHHVLKTVPSLRLGEHTDWHFAADEFDTREYPDIRMMPATTMEEPAQGNPHPEKQGCTCEQGHKLDCPVHGLNPTESDSDHSWSIPEGHPVGYPQDQPRNYMKAEGAWRISAVDPKWLSQWIKERGPYVYHGSDEDYDEAIARHGLLPWNHLPDYKPGPSEVGIGQPRPDHIYMTTEAPDPYDYSRIYKIDLRKLDPRNLNPDEDWYADSYDAPRVDATTGQRAEELRLGDDPTHTQGSMEWGKLAHRGPIPLQAISIHEPSKPEGWSGWTGLPQAEGAVEDEDEHSDNLEGESVAVPKPPADIRKKRKEREDLELVQESSLLHSAA